MSWMGDIEQSKNLKHENTLHIKIFAHSWNFWPKNKKSIHFMAKYNLILLFTFLFRQIPYMDFGELMVA